jgi:hypothetical protein
MQLGAKRVTPEAIERWKVERGYDKPLLFNAAGAGADQPDRHDLLREIPAHVRLRLRPGRRRARHRHRDPHAHGAVPGHRRADLHPWAVRHGFVCPAAGVLPGLLPGFPGGGAVRGDDVDLGPVLHHRRPVAGVEDLASGAHLGLRRGAGCVTLPGAAGGDRGDRGPSVAVPAGTARSFWRRPARTTCVRRGPRACPSCRRCSGMCSRTG